MVISAGTSYQNQPFSGNVGASTYQASDRFLVLAEAIVVTGHGEGVVFVLPWLPLLLYVIIYVFHNSVRPR